MHQDRSRQFSFRESPVLIFGLALVVVVLPLLIFCGVRERVRRSRLEALEPYVASYVDIVAGAYVEVAGLGVTPPPDYEVLAFLSR